MCLFLTPQRTDLVDSIRPYDVPLSNDDFSYQYPLPPTVNNISAPAGSRAGGAVRYGGNNNNNIVPTTTEADYQNNTNFNKMSPEKYVAPAVSSSRHVAPDGFGRRNEAPPLQRTSANPINYNLYDDDDIDEALAGTSGTFTATPLNQLGLPVEAGPSGRYANGGATPKTGHSHHNHNHNHHHGGGHSHQHGGGGASAIYQNQPHSSHASPSHSKASSYDKTDRIRTLQELGLAPDEIQEIDMRLEQELRDAVGCLMVNNERKIGQAGEDYNESTHRLRPSRASLHSGITCHDRKQRGYYRPAELLITYHSSVPS